jgi:hypothetical protein
MSGSKPTKARMSGRRGEGTMKRGYVNTKAMMAGATLVAVTMATPFVAPTAVRAKQAPAQPVTIQAALAADAGRMADKFAGLARVMAGKYDWRPGQGVRSVGEVLNLIVTENGLLNTTLLTAPGAAPAGRAGGGGGRGAAVTDPAALQEALRTTSATLQKTIAGLSDADLNTPVTLFGQNTTKRGAILLVLFDQHEHLGQSIAYARSNGVVPPWSAGGN